MIDTESIKKRVIELEIRGELTSYARDIKQVTNVLKNISEEYQELV